MHLSCLRYDPFFTFIILKSFGVKIDPPKASKIKKLIWSPPSHLWIWCNIDGSTKGNPNPAYVLELSEMMSHYF